VWVRGFGRIPDSDHGPALSQGGHATDHAKIDRGSRHEGALRDPREWLLRLGPPPPGDFSVTRRRHLIQQHIYGVVLGTQSSERRRQHSGAVNHRQAFLGDQSIRYDTP
jgi:hypothetical protein